MAKAGIRSSSLNLSIAEKSTIRLSAIQIMNQVKLLLNRALSVRVEEANSTIKIGWNPPTAITVKNPPPYLERMLEIVNEPITFSDLLYKIASEYPKVSQEEITCAIEDLIDFKVIQRYIPEQRYHRHQLYFNLFGIDHENYREILSNAKVGLIGAGGIGSTTALMLAAAGIGQIVLLDGDFLEESNLTRTLLFEESDIGEQKVIAAKKRLESRNSGIRVLTVPKNGNKEAIKHNLEGCDIWLLSADDPPYQIHQWTNQAALELGIPYIIAGYVETFGSVGPLFIPGITSCYECSLPTVTKSQLSREINSRLQAASYGPLNCLVSSIAANEIIRHLLGLKAKTLGTRLLINSEDYTINFVDFQPHQGCHCRKLEIAANLREL